VQPAPTDLGCQAESFCCDFPGDHAQHQRSGTSNCCTGEDIAEKMGAEYDPRSGEDKTINPEKPAKFRECESGGKRKCENRRCM
jgi:hypothetical protein